MSNNNSSGFRMNWGATIAWLLVIVAILFFAFGGVGKVKSLVADIKDDKTPAQVVQAQPTAVPTAIPATQPQVQPTAVPATQVQPTTVPATKLVQPTAVPQSPKVIATQAVISDLPVVRLGAPSWVPYHMALLIEPLGLDTKHGFRLEHQKFGLGDTPYPSEAEQARMLYEGDIDFLLTTLEQVNKPYADTGRPLGQVVFILDGSDGGDFVAARNTVQTVNDLAGRSVALKGGSVSEYYLFNLVEMFGLPQGSVDITRVDDLDQAAALYLSGEVDAVVGWGGSAMASVLNSGDAHKLTNSQDMQVIFDALFASAKSTEEKPEAMQACFDAFVEALDFFFQHPQEAADIISKAAPADWSYIKGGAEDFLAQLDDVAMATSLYNSMILGDQTKMSARLDFMSEVWLYGGGQALSVDALGIDAFVNPSFVKSTVARHPEYTVGTPEKKNFTMAGRPPVEFTQKQMDAADKLGDKTIFFEPNSAENTAEGMAKMDREIVPVATAMGPNVVMVITGSSHWPDGYTADQINAHSLLRAEAIRDYLVLSGVNSYQLRVDFVPARDKGQPDPTIQASYRNATITVLILDPSM